METSIVRIPVNEHNLEAELAIPEGATGLVVFSHGSGSGRHSPRNKFVAASLQQAGLATLLVDLLTEREDEDYQTRFNINLLTQRLKAIAVWVHQNSATTKLKLGIFGASTGAAAAMFAAEGSDAKALVMRGGRVDLAESVAGNLKMPTLFIVGGSDTGVLEMNQQVYEMLNCQKSIKIIPGATHLFEEPGALEQAAKLAADWFKNYL